jgi:hypothetical protein
VPAWWSGRIEGRCDRVGEEFTYEVPKVHHCRLRVAELVPGERVVWQVLTSHLSYVQDPTEWAGTTIRFEIAARPGGATVTFTHNGLVPEVECYGACSGAWEALVREDLRSLVLTGREQTGRFAG